MALAEEERTRLAVNLHQVQEKFIGEWTGESFKQQLEKNKKQHKTAMKLEKEKIMELEDQICQYNEQSDKKIEVLKQQASEVVNLEQQLHELQISAQYLLVKRKEDQHHLQELKAQVSKDKQDVLAEEGTTQHKLKQFIKGTEFFKARLGLDFKKIDVDNLQFVFKYIDPNDWERAFFFTVAIDSDKHYSVKDCVPLVNGLDTMVEELNTTNNFSKFVCSIRNKFREMVN